MPGIAFRRSSAVCVWWRRLVKWRRLAFSEGMRWFSFWVRRLEFDWVWRCVLATVLGVPAFAEKLVAAADSKGEEEPTYRVFVGTYTGGESRGIYAFDFDASTGKAGAARLVAEVENPSFLALHPNGRFLYAVNEGSAFRGTALGAVSAYRIQPDGSLALLNQMASGGGAPCHLEVDATGRCLLAANYSGGNVAVFQLSSEGSIERRTDLVQHLGSSSHPRRQRRPHAHSIRLDRNNRYAAVADLGVDKVYVYPFNPATGRLDLSRAGAVSLPPGAGPRHLAFHPNGRLAFVNNELHSSLTSLRFEPEKGRLEKLETQSTLPESYTGSNSTAEVQTHPNGQFVYVSNRGHDSIAVFGIEAASGRLTPIEREPVQGRTPRHFGIEPRGQFLFAANQKSDSIVIFRVNATTGELEPTSSKVPAPTPVCIQFLRQN